jgi:DNA-directed RNA polymerase subunit RPC12/RpoP
MKEKTVLECMECGRIFKKVVTERTEVECPTCDGVDVEVIGVERRMEK